MPAEKKLLREKAAEPYETAVVYGLSIVRCTVEKPRFPWSSEKKRENSTKPRFVHTVQRREKAVLHAFFYVRGVEPHRRKKHSTGTAPNRTVGFLICENRTEPHRRIDVI